MVDSSSQGRSAYEEPDIDTQLHRTRVQVLAAEDDSRQDSRREAAVSGRYVHLYDSRGHPVNQASRALTRRLIRAQNDVLATIGVCVANPQSNALTIQRSGTTNVFPEDGDFIDGLDCTSATGLGLLASDFACLFLATWWNAGVRYRLQVSNGPVRSIRNHQADAQTVFRPFRGSRERTSSEPSVRMSKPLDGKDSSWEDCCRRPYRCSAALAEMAQLPCCIASSICNWRTTKRA